MRFPALPPRGAWTAALVLACLGWLSPAAQAQELPGGLQLGMTPQQLQAVAPAVKRVARPAHLPGGVVGAWTGAPIQLAGVALTPTYFFADGQLRRVEYLVAQPGPGAFDALVAWGRAAWGPELASEGPEGAYAAWTQGETDAYLQRTGGTQRPLVRLVVKQRVLKDAGEL